MQKTKRENTVTGQALNDERSNQFSRYKDDNVSVFCDLILCPKAAFYMLDSFDFFRVWGHKPAQGPNPYHFMYHF